VYGLASRTGTATPSGVIPKPAENMARARRPGTRLLQMK
jgi:hypothetical protein